MADEKRAIDLGAPFQQLWPADRRQRGRLATLTLNRLGQNGVRSVADLADKTPSAIADMPGAGEGAVREVRRVLAAHGLSLREDDIGTAELKERTRRLVRAGMRAGAAIRFARQAWPKGEIAPGVTLEVSE